MACRPNNTSRKCAEIVSATRDTMTAFIWRAAGKGQGAVTTGEGLAARGQFLLAKRLQEAGPRSKLQVCRIRSGIRVGFLKLTAAGRTPRLRIRFSRPGSAVSAHSFTFESSQYDRASDVDHRPIFPHRGRSHPRLPGISFAMIRALREVEREGQIRLGLSHWTRRVGRPRRGVLQPPRDGSSTKGSLGGRVEFAARSTITI